MKGHYEEDEKYIDRLEQQIETAKRTAVENYRFLLIALNLSGRREEPETKAESLIEEHGFTKALIESNSVIDGK